MTQKEGALIDKDVKHPSHDTRSSDASTYDEVCKKCGATDKVPGGWGRLALLCPKNSKAIA